MAKNQSGVGRFSREFLPRVPHFSIIEQRNRYSVVTMLRLALILTAICLVTVGYMKGQPITRTEWSSHMIQNERNILHIDELGSKYASTELKIAGLNAKHELMALEMQKQQERLLKAEFANELQKWICGSMFLILAEKAFDILSRNKRKASE